MSSLPFEEEEKRAKEEGEELKVRSFYSERNKSL